MHPSSSKASVPDSLPFQLEYFNQDQAPSFWHPETEIYFILSGTALVIKKDRSFPVQSEDVFLINPGEARQISGTSWEAAAVTFRQDMLHGKTGQPEPRFEICSSGNTYSTRYDYIRYCISSLVSLQSKKEQGFSSLSVFYALLSHLQANFPAPHSVSLSPQEQNSERLLSIISYINTHFRENLSLTETAGKFNLSAPYFSAFFKKHTGKTFFEYYNEVKLSHAVKDLLFTGDSIETIAAGNGFSDSRAFTALFKKEYHTLPNSYRKDHSTSPVCSADGAPAPERRSAKDLSSFPSLSKYTSVFREETDFMIDLNENPRVIDAGSVDICSSHPRKHLTHNFHNMICVGSAKQFLYKEVQDMLIRVQKEVHFHYVKFHGLLSDDMMVYSLDAKGTAHYSFTFVDKAVDFILSIGLRPLCQLSFMPIALASDPSRLMDFYHYNTSPPKSIREWCALVDALIRHFISRYGLEEVKKWLFCVWNEPDETAEPFAWDDRYLFFDFYEQTFRTVKNICPDFVFGTPSMLISLQKDSGWAGDFFQYTFEHGCTADFLNLHYYDNSMFEGDTMDRARTEKGFSATNLEDSFPLTADPYAFSKFISNLKDLMRRHNMRSLPIYLTEWNLTISHRDLINDTCFKSCHLVKNLLENYDRLRSFSYWCLTDFIEELQIADHLYHGGLGLFTYNGIPKANYNAFRLLSRLGDDLLEQGDGYFITRTGDRIAMMLYNYEHYSRLFAMGQRTAQDMSDRYATFTEKNTAQFTVRLTGFHCREVLVREFYVSQYAGSSYDIWAQMGSGPLSAQDNELLKRQSDPGVYLHKETIQADTLMVHIRMAPLEVRLVEIEPLEQPG